MALHPAPKPLRAPRLEVKQAKRLARRAHLARRSNERQRTHYGVPKGERGTAETWPQFKARILARDRHVCLVCGGRLGVTVHHLVGVGAGGKNKPENAATLCAACHDDAGTGQLRRETLQGLLVERYGYGAPVEPPRTATITATIADVVYRGIGRTRDEALANLRVEGQAS